MEKKIIKLTENELHKIVEQTATQVMNTMTGAMPYQINTQSGMITEMARINTKESGNCIFPYNAFNVHIWSNDHEPPHFHVESNGWNISFLISNGEVYKINNAGNDRRTYKYILNNVKSWLSSQSAIIPQITNQQNAIAIWQQLHDE